MEDHAQGDPECGGEENSDKRRRIEEIGLDIGQEWGPAEDIGVPEGQGMVLYKFCVDEAPIGEKHAFNITTCKHTS